MEEIEQKLQRLSCRKESYLNIYNDNKCVGKYNGKTLGMTIDKYVQQENIKHITYIDKEKILNYDDVYCSGL